MSKKNTAKRQKARKKEQRNQILKWVGIGAVIIAAFLLVVLLSGGVIPPQSEMADTITVSQAYDKYHEGVYVLDVRTQEEWDAFHAPEATLIPLDELPNRINEVPKDQEIVVVCRSGNRSQVGRDILKDAGYSQVTSMDGGMVAWSNAGYPIVGSAP